MKKTVIICCLIAVATMAVIGVGSLGIKALFSFSDAQFDKLLESVLEI